MPITHRPARALAAALALAAACRSAPSRPAAPAPSPSGAATRPVPPLNAVIPAPTSVDLSPNARFTLAQGAGIVVDGGSAEAAGVGEYLAHLLRPSTGYPLPVSAAGGPAQAGGIALRLDAARAGQFGEEGYELRITGDSVRIAAASPAGLFYGVQTLRQLLPFSVESEFAGQRSTFAWTVPTGTVTDRPRFPWRGAMLDVARHFFTVKEVKQLVDVLALYKMNTLHLHLGDDQGWRIQIDSWPRLAEVGGSSQVGGGPGGYFTKADYAELVRYARERFITVVPEIDMPAHSNAAIAAYPELGCSRPRPTPSPNAPNDALYTGTRVGWSALCWDKDTVYKFVDDVVRELAAMTPGPYIHLGGDEVEVLTHEQYASFIERVQDIVERHGKRYVGWEEITRARLHPTSISQQWRSDSGAAAVRQGVKILLSPAPKAYLDMKYNALTEMGLAWAGFVEVRTAYDWEPASYAKGATERDIVGVEGPLWTETVENIVAAEYLIMPKLPALAEVAWSDPARKDWESFRTRLGSHGPRWRLMGVNYYPSTQVPWQ